MFGEIERGAEFLDDGAFANDFEESPRPPNRNESGHLSDDLDRPLFVGKMLLCREAKETGRSATRRAKRIADRKNLAKCYGIIDPHSNLCPDCQPARMLEDSAGPCATIRSVTDEF